MSRKDARRTATREIVALVALAALGLAAAAESRSEPAQGATNSSPQEAGRGSKAPAGAILCRVLEVKSVPRLHVELAIFHQANNNGGERLGEQLRARDAATAQFQTPDGAWHSATVLRLAACFGRGLLVFPSGSASLARREEIWVKIPLRTRSLGVSAAP